MSTDNESYFVIDDLDGYWTIKKENTQKYSATKFHLSGTITQYSFSSLKDTERHILHHFFENYLPFD